MVGADVGHAPAGSLDDAGRRRVGGIAPTLQPANRRRGAQALEPAQGVETHRANAVRNTRRRTGRKDVQTAGRTHQGVQIRGRSPASGQKFRRIALKNLEIRIFYIPLHSQLGNMPCGNSSVGRAQPCQGWGREFESRFPLPEPIIRSGNRGQKPYISMIYGVFLCLGTMRIKQRKAGFSVLIRDQIFRPLK